MLLYQDPKAQELIKKRFLEDIKYIGKVYGKGPYFCGLYVTISDVVMAPWFERMAVLEHYRDFRVSEEIHGWVNWCE